MSLNLVNNVLCTLINCLYITWGQSCCCGDDVEYTVGVQKFYGHKLSHRTIGTLTECHRSISFR